MFQPQPSAQGIAALYQGNPGALQQKIQKDQQAKPGMPQDLSKLMALNIVTNENDAVKRQEAMNQLQQLMGQQPPMGGVPGQPPTVAQSIEAQAKQKMATMAAEQAKQQQAMQAQPPQEQPEQQAQAQGIDQLPAEFKMAGGGIVAFANEGATLDAATREIMKELGISARDFIDNPETAKTVRSLAAERGVAVPVAEAAAPAATGATTAAEAGGLGRLYNMGKMAGKVVKGAGPAAVGAEVIGNMGDYKFDKPDKIDTSLGGTLSDLGKGEFGRAGTGLMRGLGEAGMDLGSTIANLADYVVPGKAPVSRAYEKMLTSNIDDLRGPSSAQAANKPAVTPSPIPLTTEEAEQARAKFAAVDPRLNTPRTVPTMGTAPTPEVNALEQRLKQLQSTGNVNVPGAPRSGAGLPSAVGIPLSPTMQEVAKLKPEEEKLKAEKEMEGLAPSSKYADMAMAEYDRRAKQLERPTQGYGAFMDLMGQIAQTPRGIGSLTAGAMGAQKVKELQKQSEADIFDLTMKKFDLGFKNDEAKRLFAVETKKIGREAYNNTFQNVLKAGEQEGANARTAATNATTLASAAMQVAQNAHAANLRAEMDLRQMMQTERKGNLAEESAARQRLIATGELLKDTMKDPLYQQNTEAEKQKHRATLNAIISKLAADAGIASVSPSLREAPKNPVAGALKP